MMLPDCGSHAFTQSFTLCLQELASQNSSLVICEKVIKTSADSFIISCCTVFIKSTGTHRAIQHGRAILRTACGWEQDTQLCLEYFLAETVTYILFHASWRAFRCTERTLLLPDLPSSVSLCKGVSRPAHGRESKRKGMHHVRISWLWTSGIRPLHLLHLPPSHVQHNQVHINWSIHKFFQITEHLATLKCARLRVWSHNGYLFEFPGS